MALLAFELDASVGNYLGEAIFGLLILHQVYSNENILLNVISISAIKLYIYM